MPDCCCCCCWFEQRGQPFLLSWRSLSLPHRAQAAVSVLSWISVYFEINQLILIEIIWNLSFENFETQELYSRVRIANNSYHWNAHREDVEWRCVRERCGGTQFVRIFLAHLVDQLIGQIHLLLCLLRLYLGSQMQFDGFQLWNCLKIGLFLYKICYAEFFPIPDHARSMRDSSPFQLVRISFCNAQLLDARPKCCVSISQCFFFF